MLVNLKYPVFFTQANDYSDLRGETRVFEKLFDNKVNFIKEPIENPFRAVTNYTEDSTKSENETSWCCANTHLYGIKGWKSDLPDG